MAPVKISHVVSFSSQDPKYPVENLLREDNLHPWLGCPQDRSRQLRVELQLERASPIGYVDIGNCGCAFLQMEVGRSSWPLDRPYLTLVPSVALMTPADARRDQNRCGVRMLKEADFLAPAVGQKWDRLRVTCSQPFHKHSQFGLSFIRVRTPQDPQDLLPPPGPEDPPKDAEPTDGPWCSSPAFCRTFFPEPRSSSREEERLQSRLQQLEPSAGSPARLSRPAQMLLSVARSRALRPRAGSGAPGGDPDPGGPVVPGSTQDVPTVPGRARRRREGRQRAPSSVSRSLPTPSRQSRVGGRAQARSHRERRARRGDSGGDSGDEMGVCPICSARFSLDLLPTHAASCGEEDPSVTAQPSSPPPWIPCPICQLPFDATEVELHASACGEPGGTLGGTAGTPSLSHHLQ